MKIYFYLVIYLISGIGVVRIMNEKVSTVLVTYPDEQTARMISKSLVDRRLAACSNIFPIESIYRWDGEVKESSEYASLIMIRPKDFSLVEEFIRDIHPYEVPCIVQYHIENGLRDYMSWIITSTNRS